MAAEHYDLYDEEHEHDAGNTKKRSRITIDLTPELRRRVRIAALKRDLSISEYVGQILEDRVPLEETPSQRQHHPVTRKTLEALREIREEILRERQGKPFEDSAEMIDQMRDERTRELMGEL